MNQEKLCFENNNSYNKEERIEEKEKRKEKPDCKFSFLILLLVISAMKRQFCLSLKQTE